MSKITIREVDLTTVAGATEDIADIVYVPGFSSASADSASTAKKGVPTLCRTIAEFNTYFGTQPAVFKADQDYPSSSGFSDAAIPKVNQTPQKMFLKGDPDPSYIYAKELLARGLPVIYERVNTKSDINDANYDVTVATMYTFLGTAFSSIPTAEASTSIVGSTVTVDDVNEFIAAYPDADTYVLTYKAAATGVTAGWYLGSESTPVVLGDIGLSLSGSPTLEGGETITVLLYYAEPALLDKSLYDVKYITSGGYPTFEYNGVSITQQMASLAQRRGDCIAFIDHTNNPYRTVVGQDSVIFQVRSTANKLSSDVASYATMLTPYCSFALANNYNSVNASDSGYALPASFAYLICLAASIQNNPAWLAIAGAGRGKVNSLVSVSTDRLITNAIADSYVSDTNVSINPITNVRPYGQCIWGNRTLVDNSVLGGTKALSYLNIRNLVCDVKKQLFMACQSLLFEPNTDTLWANFTSRVTPLLDAMKSGNGIGNYKIIRVDPSDKAQITAIVRIYPVYAVEAFDLTLYIQNGELAVEE